MISSIAIDREAKNAWFSFFKVSKGTANSLEATQDYAPTAIVKNDQQPVGTLKHMAGVFFL